MDTGPWRGGLRSRARTRIEVGEYRQSNFTRVHRPENASLRGVGQCHSIECDCTSLHVLVAPHSTVRRVNESRI